MKTALIALIGFVILIVSVLLIIFMSSLIRVKTVRKAEEKILETAEWIGNTGLPEEWERELPRYLRREFGQFYHQENSLKAKDLIYVGTYKKGDGFVHFWEISSYEHPGVYAYIEDINEGSFGWGNEKPPE